MLWSRDEGSIIFLPTDLKDSPSIVDQAQATLAEDEAIPGGIDLNPNNTEIERKGQGRKINFTFDKKSFRTTDIQGLVSIIMNITPLTNIPQLIASS